VGCSIDYQPHFGHHVGRVTALYARYAPQVEEKTAFRLLSDKLLAHVNKIFGLDYWSNRINSWEDFPSTTGTINGSLGCEFAIFQRKLVTHFLAWQVSIVNDY
jgi:beta-galactosidase